MPSIDDVFNQLVAANTKLAQIDEALAQIAAIGTYGDQVLTRISNQSDTLICILEKISRQTCGTWNEAHLASGLLTSIKNSDEVLVDILKGAYPAAAVDVERAAKVKEELERCCPKEEPEPICTYSECEAPPPLPNAPQLPARAGSQTSVSRK